MGYNSQALSFHSECLQLLIGVVCEHDYAIAQVEEETPEGLVIEFALGTAVWVDMKVRGEDHFSSP